MKYLKNILKVLVLSMVLWVCGGWAGCQMREFSLLELKGVKAGTGNEICQCECDHKDCNLTCKCVPNCEGCDCEKQSIDSNTSEGRSPTY